MVGCCYYENRDVSIFLLSFVCQFADAVDLCLALLYICPFSLLKILSPFWILLELKMIEVVMTT